MAGDVFEGFDEGTYLAANPDVARAVALGQLGGALEHYSAFGLCEHRPGVDARAADAIRQWVAAAEAQPLPPPELRVRVHGGGDERSFADVGRHLTIDLFRALRRCGLALPHDAEVLDFGCGRAAPYVASAAAMRLYGCDIDAAAIAWSRQHLRALGEFVHNSHWPPLPFAACSFDFVYATSVFTHLPQDMEDAWLAELARVTCPGGVLLLTTPRPGTRREAGGRRAPRAPRLPVRAGRGDAGTARVLPHQLSHRGVHPRALVALVRGARRASPRAQSAPGHRRPAIARRLTLHRETSSYRRLAVSAACTIAALRLSFPLASSIRMCSSSKRPSLRGPK